MKTLKVLTFLALAIAFTAIAGTFLDWKRGMVYEVGNSIPDFVLKNTEGQYVSLADYERAKGFIIVFTSYRCPYSYDDERKLKNLQKRYGRQGYPVLAIDPTISEEDIFQQLRQQIGVKSFAYPYLIDEGQKVAKRFGVQKIPQVFILRKEDGFNILKYAGAIDSKVYNAAHKTHDYVAAAMDVLLIGGELKVSTTNPTGCTLL